MEGKPRRRKNALGIAERHPGPLRRSNKLGGRFTRAQCAPYRFTKASGTPRIFAKRSLLVRYWFNAKTDVPF